MTDATTSPEVSGAEDPPDSPLEPTAVGDPPGAAAPAPVPLPVYPELSLAGRWQRKQGIGRLLYRVANRLERRRLLEQVPFPAGSQGGFLRRYNGRLRFVEVVPGLIGADAVRRNVDIVVACCEAAEIPYFAVPEPNARRTRIGIADESWPAFVAALHRRGVCGPLYVAVAARSGRRVRRWPELITDPRIARAARDQRQVEVFAIASPGPHGRLFDRPWACVVDRWARGENCELQAPRANARSTSIGMAAQAPAIVLHRGRRLSSLRAFADRDLFDIDFPIDAVYTWVDGGDPLWRARQGEALAAHGLAPILSSAGTERFRDNGELRYSLRSLAEFAPWIRQVYLVTDDQVPTWLDTSSPRITVVDHREIFGSAGVLPTFNSHAIGARLHHIVGLSEHYLHFNDDVFLGRDVLPSTFFHSNGTSKFFLSRSTLAMADEGDAPAHEDARRNVVKLLARDFGRSPARAFFHTPIAQRRSTLFELERRYPEQFAATWSHQFRHPEDYEVNSWLHHYYGYITGKAVPGRIAYDYFDMTRDASWARLRALARNRNRDVFCINDSPGTTEEQLLRAMRWLDDFYPEPAPFEI